MKLKLALVAVALCLVLTTTFGCAPKDDGYSYVPVDGYARFLANCDKSEVSVPSGFTAVGGDVLVHSQKIGDDGIVKQPQTTPERKGYDFDGWCLDKEGTKEFDFSVAVSGGVTLFARWKRSATSVDEDNYVEPVLRHVVNVDENQTDDVVVLSVCGELISGNEIVVSEVAFDKLSSSDDVLQMVYVSVKDATAALSASFRGNTLTVSSGEFTTTVTVKKAPTSLWTVDNDYYENKAVKYEQYDIVPHSVILAGSSSMENWTTSQQDAKPLTTLNVGIGGTTVEMWTNALTHRLVYRHDPRAVVFYVGINNIINSGDSGATTGNKIVELLTQVNDHLPNAHVYFVLINYVPGYMSYKLEIDQANNIVKEFSADKNWLTLIDAGSLLVKSNGTPNKAYFLADGLHMSVCGYALWGEKVKQTIIETEKELYK